MPNQQRPGEGARSALAGALQDALSALPREEVLRCVADAIPADTDRSGTAAKVSVSMPRELAEAVRARTGSGGFSRYVTDAVQRQVRLDLMGEFIDDFESRNGPIPEELIDNAAREWPDSEAED